MGASPRSLAAEANGCFMVGIQHGSNRIQGRGASVARDGGLPSDLLNVSTEASDYLKRKKSGEVRRRDGLTNKSPYKRRPWESLSPICRLSRPLGSIWPSMSFKFMALMLREGLWSQSDEAQQAAGVFCFAARLSCGARGQRIGASLGARADQARP